MIKVILKETWTKRDASGNVYHTVTVTNTKNGKSFTTETPSLSNVIGILNRMLGLKCNEVYTCSVCTDSARYSSLPEHINLDQCHPSAGWKTNLNKIGYRLSK